MVACIEFSFLMIDVIIVEFLRHTVKGQTGGNEKSWLPGQNICGSGADSIRQPPVDGGQPLFHQVAVGFRKVAATEKAAGGRER
jgi:hypothetical protein